MTGLWWPCHLPAYPQKLKLPRWLPGSWRGEPRRGAAEVYSLAFHLAGSLHSLTFLISSPRLLRLEVSDIGKLQKEKKERLVCEFTPFVELLLTGWAAQQGPVWLTLAALATGGNGGMLGGGKKAAGVLLALLCHQCSQHPLHPP